MGLKEKLDAHKKDFASSAPKHVIGVMERALKDRLESGMMDRVVREGDHAPDFRLNNAYGDPVHLRERLAEGPVVFGFYRGRW